MTKKEMAIEKAKEILKKVEKINPAHNVAHTESTLFYTHKIAQNLPEVNVDILDLAVWWHDTGRLYLDEGHAKKSAEMARDELTKMGYEQDFVANVYEAIKNHSMRDKPNTIEGDVLRDADKLDFLTPKRWQTVIDNKNLHSIQIGLRGIPVIRNKILALDISKEIFDQLWKELKIFADKNQSEYFAPYKKELLRLKLDK